MLRKTLAILSLLGLLLSVGLWILGAFRLVHFVPQSLRYYVGVNDAFINVMIPDEPFEMSNEELVGPSLVMNWDIQKDIMTMDKAFAQPGFAFEESSGAIRFRHFPRIWRENWPANAVIVPHWFQSSMFGLAFLACRPWVFLRRRKRKKLGLCMKCGYDLRGSKERCPECGTEFGSSGVGELLRRTTLELPNS